MYELSPWAANEPVGKVLLTSENDVFGGDLTLPKYEIVDCGAFCEVIFSTSHPRICLGTFSTASTFGITGLKKRQLFQIRVHPIVRLKRVPILVATLRTHKDIGHCIIRQLK